MMRLSHHDAEKLAQMVMEENERLREGLESIGLSTTGGTCPQCGELVDKCGKLSQRPFNDGGGFCPGYMARVTLGSKKEEKWIDGVKICPMCKNKITLKLKDLKRWKPKIDATEE